MFINIIIAVELFLILSVGCYGIDLYAKNSATRTYLDKKNLD